MKKKKLVAIFSILSLLFIPLYFSRPLGIRAADLTAVKDRMNRMEDSLTTGVEHNFIFTAATNVSGGSGNNEVSIEFPDADDGLWCRTAGALGVTAITTDPSHSGSFTGLPGTLSASCSQGGVGTYDTITITGVNDLSASTTYGVNVDDSGAGALGTPTTGTTGLTTLITNDGGSDIDSGTFNLEIVDDDTVTVTADVGAVLQCSLDTTTVAFGTVSPNPVAASATDNNLDIAIETNATNGYAWVVYDAGSGSNPGLYDSSTTSIIGSADDSYNNTADLSASTEGYGMYMTDPDAGGAAAVDTRYDGGATSDVGGFEVGTDNAIAAITDSSATTASESSNVTFVVNVNSSTPYGSYTDDVTFVCVGRF